ncbi:Acid phosphatase [Hondaea fermentalgiana]|uniref:Purple acid phosphatase n=1 Tax=Hondaea fermentalgiana TaxID=2315210 RepID=A0A2R5G0R2_9STRA|nr:Acid phosphatase [Hondaea fermentalgiana]|eukprot:GBG24602.1 Acid phosphatase [Hondaea fermentalgiana]
MVGKPKARVLAVVFVMAVVATLAKPTFAVVSCDEAFSQLHLALVDGPHKMSISWTQAIAFPAYRKRYFMSWHYHALVTNLVPDEYYCYEVQAGLGDCFKTGPAQTRPAQGVRFASLGDMGTNNSQGTTAALLSRVNELDFVLHDGDIGYGDDLGVFTHDQTRRRYSNLERGPEGYEIVYDEFMAQIEPIARKIPYMTGAGNHDVSCNILSDLNCAVGQRNFSAYRTRFRMPSAESGAGDIEGMWHSFTFANVHIAVIDTESDYKSAPTTPWTRVGGGRGGGFGDQVTWLDADLARARANPAVDWILLQKAKVIFLEMSLMAFTMTLHRNANSYDFVLHDGDIGYGDDLGFVGVGASRMYGPSGYEAIYDEFMDQIEPFARKIPYMTSPGNHDVSCHILYDAGCAPGQRNFSAYRTRFHMPSKESGAGEVEGMWHSFEYANVHIAVIDTETDYKGAPTHPRKRFGGGKGGGFGDQMAWLESDLAHARANAAIDWIIVVGHRQMYSSRSLIHQLSPRVTIALRDAVEILLLRYNVDLYLGAHIHYYERFAPMARGSSCGPAPARGGIYHAPQCPVHIINGAAGSCEPAQSRGSRLANVGHGVYNEYGFAEFHVQNTTHLQGRFVITTDGDEREGDSFWIIKPPPVNNPGSQRKPFALEI